MIKTYADAGTSWTKIFEVPETLENLNNSPLEDVIAAYSSSSKLVETRLADKSTVKGRLSLVPTKIINQHKDIMFDAATGHMSTSRIKKYGKYENELVALAIGGMKVIQEADVTLVDLGSRDSKWIKYRNYKYKDLDWNGSCGSGTGATIEMVCNFYEVDTDKLPLEKEKIAVTCGVFGMEKIMDMVARGIPAETAISRYIHGIAFNVWNFARCPDKLYLSGGLCLNKCFVESLGEYCEVVPMGRFILLEGLY